MHISEVRIENFRLFGEGADALVLRLGPGLTALVGENDCGKSAVIDAIRFALGTRDQEFLRLEEADFHAPRDGSARRAEIRVRCRFDSLSADDESAFLEYLTFEDVGSGTRSCIFLNWTASTVVRKSSRRTTAINVRSGAVGDGPHFEPEARALLNATYLRPLRDAHRELSAGRGSRLSQILHCTREISEQGVAFDSATTGTLDPRTLNVLGIGDYANHLLETHAGVGKARDRLNSQFLQPLLFTGDDLHGVVTVNGASDDNVRLRQLLEKLELELRERNGLAAPTQRGMGSNNLLFMACELLLLGADEESLPLLLVEEPEAHLHPQRQLLLMKFFQEKAKQLQREEDPIQIIITTHSPNLSSAIDTRSLIILNGSQCYSLSPAETLLAASDYAFLQRFLDVTKANMFFARAVVIVEGDAENILIPTLARMLGRDFTSHGVSIVNVGGVGLRRFARIYQRSDAAKRNAGELAIPVACVTDLDVMPDCAPEIVRYVKKGDSLPPKDDRKWRVVSDYPGTMLADRRKSIDEKASGQNVRTFVADNWTLEFEFARGRFQRYLFLATQLAKESDDLHSGKKPMRAVLKKALKDWAALKAANLTADELATRVYSPLVTNSRISKATTAQYLAELLERLLRRGRQQKPIPVAEFEAALPRYLVDAITYVTTPLTASAKEAESDDATN